MDQSYSEVVRVSDGCSHVCSIISGVGSGVIVGVWVGGGLVSFGGSDGVLVGSAADGSVVGVLSLVGSGVTEILGSIDGDGSIVGVSSSLGVGVTTSGVAVGVTSFLFGCSGAITGVGVGVSVASCANVLEDIKKPGVND